jgi:hypothetical protein
MERETERERRGGGGKRTSTIRLKWTETKVQVRVQESLPVDNNTTQPDSDSITVRLHYQSAMIIIHHCQLFLKSISDRLVAYEPTVISLSLSVLNYPAVIICYE